MAARRIIQPHENSVIAESRVEEGSQPGEDIGPKRGTTSLGSRCRQALSFPIAAFIVLFRWTESL
ncbi:predicted protein [Chaetomium globosum CBS 148.51]|uniref:Uncharacterized protein n=1 Tax=Chaetomium globosum (strain ATCC 6205 / CBS 148.51 / DSM 1962 / NBRC 6347 / NRRL 1970) TaxID=306901 RepID=Q2HGN5_CHAGB|nr:uncharacterized protein CHGG_00619 [Chaetomium globosum CBS 148.51]EAQ92384.1 predicted protein [Chaetomium globosum CBS 148.51]